MERILLRFGAILCVSWLAAASVVQAQTTVNYNYSGGSQSWTVPPCVYSISIVAEGGEGGFYPGDASGGDGAVVTATIAVTPGSTVTMIVGGAGTCPNAGYNGGGTGYNSTVAPAAYGSCGGGGATTVSVNGSSVLIAAGGGGAGGGSVSNNIGGNGGCASGVAGGNTFGAGGGGGTQVSGGSGGAPWAGTPPGGQSGSFGQGGQGGLWQTASGGGGGGGYYGGGGGGNDGCCTGGNGGGGGGGGSSLIPAGGGCVAGGNTGAGTVSITYTLGSPAATASNTGPYCAGQTIQLNATGGGTYSWTGPNGFTSNTQNPTISNATAANAGTYTVTVSNGACTGTASTTVVINPLPTVNPVTPQALCAGATTSSIAFSGSIPATTYNWTNSNTATGLAASGTGNIAAFTAQNATSNAITSNITVTPVSGSCTGTPGSFTITVSPVPTVDAVTSQTLCAGASTNAINFTGAVAGTTYDWTNNNTATGLGASGSGNITSFAAQNTTSNAITSTISVTPVNGSCVGTPTTFSITVNPTPTVDPLTSQTHCTGAPTSAVNFTGTVAGTTYNWSNNNTATGLVASGSGNIASFTTQNTTSNAITSNITVTPVSGSCTGTPGSFTITVSPVPTVDAVISQTLCAGASTNAINFTGAVAGTTYDWTNNNTSIGLGASGSGNIASFVAQNTTSNAITSTISVTPVNGSCVGTPTTFSITVNPTPSVDPLTSQTHCTGATTSAVNFTGTVAGTTYDWTNNNTATGLGASGSGNIASYATAQVSNQEVSVVSVTPVTSSGCVGQMIDFTITVNPLPLVDAGTNQVVCEGTLITLTGSGALSYTWTGIVTQGVPFAQNPGSVTYSVSGTDANGCTNVDDVDVTVNANPIVNAGNDQAVCPGVQVILSGSGALSYSWSGGITDLVAFTPSQGTTVYTVTGTDNNGCTDTDQVNVTVYANPVVNAGADVTICDGASVTLTANGAQNYVWNNGVVNAVSFIPSSTNTYSVTGTDINGCTDTDDVLVTVEATPQPEFYASNLMGCEPLSTTLVNTTIGNLSNCTWTISNGQTYTGCGSVGITIPTAGLYDVTLNVVSSNGCQGQTTYNNYLYVEAIPLAAFSANTYELTIFDTSIDFFNSSSGAVSYLWDFGDESGSVSIENPSHTFPDESEGSYIIQLIASSPLGCTDTVTHEVTVVEELIYYIPNTFTPDGDAFNQTFKPIFSSGLDIYNYNFYLFNRWGEVVWESHNPEIGWDGTYGSGGKLGVCPVGEYTWSVDFKVKGKDDRRRISGHVNLIR